MRLGALVTVWEDSLDSIDQRPMFSWVLLQGESLGIKLFGNFPFPYHPAILDLLDGIGIDLAVWRLL